MFAVHARASAANTRSFQAGASAMTLVTHDADGLTVGVDMRESWRSQTSTATWPPLSPSGAGTAVTTSSARWAAAAQGLPILAVVIVGLLHLHQAGFSQDEGALLVYAERILHGAVAHRDFQSMYGPGMPWVLGGVFLITGPSLVAERLLSVLIAASVVLLVTRIARRWGPVQGAVAGSLAAVSVVQLPPYASVWLVAVALILTSLAVTTSVDGRTQTPWRFARAGLLAALALSFRVDLAPAVVLCALPLVLRRERLFAWYACGAIAGVVPLGVHTIVATPAAVFQNVFVDAVFHSPARHLPVPPTDLATAFDFFAVLTAVALAAVASVIAHRRARGSPLTRLLQALTALSIGLLPEVLQRADAAHIPYAAFVCFATVPISLRVIAQARRSHTLRILAPATFAACLAATLAAQTMPGVPVANAGRAFLVDQWEYSDARAVLADVNRMATPGQRVFVGPADMRRTNNTATYLYFLLPDLVPSTYFLEMNPLTANSRDSRLAADVASADVLILTTEWSVWTESNASAQFGSDTPNQVVDRSFCLRATDGMYRVYTRCRAT